MDNMNDEIFEYKSTLFKTSSSVKDSLLQIVYHYRSRYSKYALLILQSLLNVANCDDEARIYQYMKVCEPPTYAYSRYIDWIKPYIRDRIQYCSNNPNMGNNKHELPIAINAYNIFETIEKKIENEEYFKELEN